MSNKLNFKRIIMDERLVSTPTLECIKNTFSKTKINDIFVAEINPLYMDGKKLCEHYNIDVKNGS